jgi:thiol-disulfide isomerase/thioredoxin
MRGFHITLTLVAAALVLSVSNEVGAALPLPGAAMSSIPALHGKPLVVRVHADWCGECQTSLPDFLAFTKSYRGKINVVDIDVTDGKTAAIARARAERFGFGAYYELTKAAPLTVAFINPNSNTLYAALRGNVTLSQLVSAEKAVEDSLKGR